MGGLGLGLGLGLGRGAGEGDGVEEVTAHVTARATHHDSSSRDILNDIYRIHAVVLVRHASLRLGALLVLLVAVVWLALSPVAVARAAEPTGREAGLWAAIRPLERGLVPAVLQGGG